jgi:hypothetical protein
MGTRPSRDARRRGQALALAVAFALTARGAAAQVAVDELELHVSLRPGALGLSQTFHAANAGRAAANAMISAEDWDRSEGGENRYYPLGSLPTTCGHHVSVFPSVLRLEPRSVQTIQVTVDSADAIPHGCYTILFVETERGRGPGSSGLVYSVRYGVKVYVERDAPLSGEVTAMSIVRRPRSDTPSDTESTALTLSFHNSGSRQTETRGKVEVRRLDDSVISTIDIPAFPTLPSATRRLDVPIPPLAHGKYVLLAMLDYGGQEIAAGQASLEVP